MPLDNYHRFEGVPIGSLKPGDLFCLPWDPFLTGPLGEVKIVDTFTAHTNLGPFGRAFVVIPVERSHDSSSTDSSGGGG